jgi:CPA2 family monovalent cation:H+ antiporter-2
MAMGHGLHSGLRVAVSLAQVGEFTFMLVVLGTQLGVLPAEATNATVAVAIISITLNPILYRAIPGIQKRMGRGAIAGAPAIATLETPRRFAVVVGYGPLGEYVCRLLQERGIVPTVIELNIDTVHRLNSQGIRAVFGDAARQEVMEEAGSSDAGALIITAPGSPEFAEVIRTARATNPAIQVLVRSAFLSQNELLLKAGADEVFSGEGEVATAMIEAMLRHLGVGPEQIAAERDRARTILYSGLSDHA